MDLLYSRYSNPLELMNTYINQGRFGDFVAGFCESEYNRKKEEAERDEENRLWTAYMFSSSKLNFSEWKKELYNKGNSTTAKGGDESLDNEGIKAIISDLFPDNSSQETRIN